MILHVLIYQLPSICTHSPSQRTIFTGQYISFSILILLYLLHILSSLMFLPVNRYESYSPYLVFSLTYNLL